jgi:hypothetical protein
MNEINLNFYFDVPKEVLAVLSVIQPKDALDIYLGVQSAQNQQLGELVQKTRASLPPFMRFIPKLNDQNPLNYDMVVQVLNDLKKGGKVREKENPRGETEYLLTR